MTPRADELHRLIADLDNLLATTDKHFPKLVSSQAQAARQVLERIRDFLARLGQTEDWQSNTQVKVSAPPPLSPLLARFVEENIQSSPQHEQPNPQPSDAVGSLQVDREFSPWLQPLRDELTGLLQERANLVQEIRLLEQKRSQNYSLTQQLANQEQVINEFLQVLMQRLVPSLASQMTQNSPQVNPAASTTAPLIETYDQTERLSLLTRDLDQRLVSLDGTVNVVFEALQRNINTYHESLSQALARMHSQGLQGEQLMASFFENLTQYLQQHSPGSEFSGLTPTLPASPKAEFSVLMPTLPESPDVIEPATVDEQPEPLATDDLDPIFLHFHQDDLDTQANGFDEVDQLYASLFGADYLAPTTDVSDEIETNSSPLTLNIASIPPTPPAEGVKEPDPWLEKSQADMPTEDASFADSSSHAWEALFFDGGLEPVPPLDLLSTPAATELNSADTVTTLADLFAVGEDEQLLGATEPVGTDIAEQLPTANEVHDGLSDNYILASPQENLLSPTATSVDSIPNISLDAVQLQQLELDLANLDTSAGAAFASLEIPQLTPTSFPQPEIALDFSPTIEKKKEATISAPAFESEDPGVGIVDVRESVWYLGIDLGTTGISAAVFNRTTFVVYPIYWSAETATNNSFQQSFRLPAEVYLPSTAVIHSEANINSAPKSAAEPANNLYSAQLKPYLQVAIPYKNARQKWEPVLQFNELSAGPLIWVVRSLSKLLSTLKSDRHSTTQGLSAAAVGLDEKSFTQVINNIAGVICTCPTGWSEQYRFNVREALLTSKIVTEPQQVYFIEEAIATLLSVLDGAHGEIVQVREQSGLFPAKTTEQPIVGSTLAINIGAIATEMALVDLPSSLLQLTHHDFMLHSFAYAGQAIEQDIICQLLVPPKSRQSRSELPGDSKTITSNPQHWQPSIPGLEQMQWQSLGLEELELPRVGEPDITARIRLQQRLESSLLGQAVLDAALALKLILQHQDTFTLDLADQRWVLQRRDLESQVLVPFVRRLNRELNKLLVARGIPTEAINQAVLTGGVASITTVNRWLKQKLPNAKIIQDSYLGDNGAPNCSRVAYGLAMLPLHPQVLDIPRQQYTDYFLFTELLRLLPDHSVSFNEILQLFEERGINTRTCQQRLLAFLEGELPPGLTPNTQDCTWLTPTSQTNADYQAIAAAPLFEKQGSLTYRPHSQQLQSLRTYLHTIQASTQQSLEEPYTVNFVLAAQPE
ncbi:hypothetical protein [Fortiea contorta]|uniref:hypothetical protein n=1 Tax=Fortiea contorta TaxID=1892405 RepID=UPI00034C7400|nr:hypothetical protein [Fortiea contorta]